MKTILTQLSVAAAVLTAINTYSQGFINLNFEDATVTLAYPPLTSYIYANDATPGWINYVGGVPQSIIGYDTVSLGGAAIFLQDGASAITPLQGSYSVLLEGSNASTPTAASIGQTGQIPADMVSLLFYLSLDSSIQVTFNNQIIPLVQISSSANYVVMGGDISAFAGQTGELLFTALPNVGYGLIDNIQFSSTPVPEPAEYALLGLGGLLFAWHHRKRRHRNLAR